MARKLKSVQFCGHAAVFFHGPEYTVAIDPWLQGNPACPEACKAPERIDLIILTHGHFDHASEASGLARHYGSKIVAPYELAEIMGSEGVPEGNLLGMNKGGTLEVDGLFVTLTHAMHSSGYAGKNGTVYAGEPCGIVLRDKDFCVYHAGDTALFSDMALIKEFYAPRLAILPIGDRFTMGPREAARAAQLVGAKHVIPVHHSTFPLLTGTPDEFAALCQKLAINATVMEPGQSVELARFA